MHRIEAELWIPGRGEPVYDGAARDADHLADIAVLAWPAHVTGVRRAGRRVKG
ncbi:MAG: hypothetical protein JWP76_3623 [Dactylosporangium sp.]|nr:hypothetical protein [Dactylosporangium sp.]